MEIKSPLLIQNSIQIQASAAKVWDALTNPAQTKQYMFGCETVSDWQVGSSLLWDGEYEGKTMTFVKGHIKEIEPNRLLVYTTIDPNGSIADIPENYLTVTYALHESAGATTLTVTQGDYATVADGEKRYRESMADGVGWDPILQAIKSLIENE
jgi:uncharacterized protein YndB with AHSA1/START domain